MLRNLSVPPAHRSRIQHKLVMLAPADYSFRAIQKELQPRCHALDDDHLCGFFGSGMRLMLLRR